jgi:hypothetical protein
MNAELSGKIVQDTQSASAGWARIGGADGIGYAGWFRCAVEIRGATRTR